MAAVRIAQTRLRNAVRPPVKTKLGQIGGLTTTGDTMRI
jgi:hypothetical protein